VRPRVINAARAPAIEGRSDRGRSSAALPATEQDLHLHGHPAGPLDPGKVRSPPRLARRRVDRWVEDRRARTAIPRSMSVSHTCVSPRHLNVRRAGRRSDTGGEAFEREDMDTCHLDIDGFWLQDADAKGKERATIAE
jgi:hypothetical protein